jgi:hypothetical protein
MDKRIIFLIIGLLFIMDSFMFRPILVVHDFGALCRTGTGGDVMNAAYACANEPPQALRGLFVSADTLALGIPGMCVMPNSQFYFHSARIDGTPFIGTDGNEILAQTYGRWPRLLAYLQQHHIFQSFQLIKLTGLELGHFGVPVCH